MCVCIYIYIYIYKYVRIKCSVVCIIPRNAVSTKRNMPLVYILNRSGPSIDPCGTSAIMSFYRLKLLFTPVLCKRWLKWLRIY